MQPIDALKALLRGEKPRRRDVETAARLGWVTKKKGRCHVPEGYRFVARGRVFPPLKCPHCEAVHFPHGGAVAKCSQCGRSVFEPEWVGEAWWPMEMEKYRWVKKK